MNNQLTKENLKKLQDELDYRMTVKRAEIAKEKMIAAGMNDCIYKPIEMDKICNVIRNYLPAEYIQDL